MSITPEDIAEGVKAVKEEDEAPKVLPKNPKRRHAKDEGLAEALGRLAEHLNPERQAEANRRANFPSNRQAPLISSLNPQGDKDFKRPVLPYEKIRMPYEAEPEDFTFEELELLGVIKEGEYKIRLNDNSSVLFNVVITRNANNNRPEILDINSELGYSKERRHALPPLADILRQMAGDDARKIATMGERKRWVEQKKVPVSVGA